MENTKTIEMYLKKAALYDEVEHMTGKQAIAALNALIACSDENTVNFINSYMVYSKH